MCEPFAELELLSAGSLSGTQWDEQNQRVQVSFTYTKAIGASSTEEIMQVRRCAQQPYLCLDVESFLIDPASGYCCCSYSFRSSRPKTHTTRPKTHTPNYHVWYGGLLVRNALHCTARNDRERSDEHGVVYLPEAAGVLPGRCTPPWIRLWLWLSLLDSQCNVSASLWCEEMAGSVAD
jgi:hypothetical protein